MAPAVTQPKQRRAYRDLGTDVRGGPGWGTARRPRARRPTPSTTGSRSGALSSAGSGPSWQLPRPGFSVASVARRAAIAVAAAALEACDAGTGDHSDDVAFIAQALGERLRLDGPSLSNLIAAAQLHDIGKVATPESILRKRGPLNADERAIVEQHTVVGERIVASVPELWEVAVLVRHSHEHWDGSGYPDGLVREAIPLESRIVLCADAFHAVRSSRPYRQGRPAAEAFDEIAAHGGTQFDPQVVDALGREIAERSARRFAPASDDRVGALCA
jgi:putative nucleotidyltransferase with HDIG domain